MKGHARILATALMNGEPMIWADPRLSPAGRHLLQVAEKIERMREEVEDCGL